MTPRGPLLLCVVAGLCMGCGELWSSQSNPFPSGSAIAGATSASVAQPMSATLITAAIASAVDVDQNGIPDECESLPPRGFPVL